MQGALFAELAGSIANGSIRVVDLTQTLRPSKPIIQLPPDWGGSRYAPAEG
jgi:hypothetical protein